MPLFEKKIFYGQIFFWVIWITSLNSQTITSALYLGKKEPEPQWFEYSSVDRGLVTISYASRTSSRYINLYKYDANFNRSWYQQLYEQNGRKSILNLAVLGERILVFIHEKKGGRNEPERHYYLSYMLNGAHDKQEKTLEVPAGLRRDNIPQMQFERSSNKKYLLAWQNFSTEKENEKLLCFVFSTDTQYVSTRNIELPAPDNEIKIHAVRISNKGTIFILARKAPEGRIRNFENAKWVLYRIGSEMSVPEVIDIHFNNKIITDLTFRIDKNDNAILGGFYSNKSKGKIIGTLYGRADSGSIKMTEIAANALPTTFLQNYLSSRQIEKGRELDDIYLDNIILRSDGGVLLLAEQYYVTSTSYRDVYGYWYNRNLFHYDDIILIALSPEGKIEWNTIIEKSQSAESNFELSYVPVVAGDGIYVFYKTRKKGLGANIYFQKVTDDGKLSVPKGFLSEFSESDTFYRKSCEQISNNEAILVYYQSRKRLFSLLKVSFQD
jgi:hypothetical protein